MNKLTNLFYLQRHIRRHTRNPETPRRPQPVASSPQRRANRHHRGQYCGGGCGHFGAGVLLCEAEARWEAGVGGAGEAVGEGGGGVVGV